MTAATSVGDPDRDETDPEVLASRALSRGAKARKDLDNFIRASPTSEAFQKMALGLVNDLWEAAIDVAEANGCSLACDPPEVPEE